MRALVLIISGIFFQNAFTSIANRHAPFMHKLVRGVDNSPWLNSDINRDMTERDYFLVKARKTRLSENWTKYRYFRNLVTGKIRKVKDAYNRRVIEEDGHDSKAFWGTVKKLLTSYSKEPSLTTKIENNLSSDKRSISNPFNKYFTNAVTCLLVDSLRSSVASACSSLTCRSSSLPVMRRRPVFQFPKVTESFFLKQLKGLKTKKPLAWTTFHRVFLKTVVLL